MTGHRESFKAYDGPIAWVTVPAFAAGYLIDKDREKLAEVEEWCANNCAGQYWVMWTPRTNFESRSESWAIFVEDSDAALFLLTHNLGLMNHGHARNGIVNGQTL